MRRVATITPAAMTPAELDDRPPRVSEGVDVDGSGIPGPENDVVGIGSPLDVPGPAKNVMAVEPAVGVYWVLVPPPDEDVEEGADTGRAVAVPVLVVVDVVPIFEMDVLNMVSVTCTVDFKGGSSDPEPGLSSGGKNEAVGKESEGA